MTCPRCGTETNDWPCPSCGFPVIRVIMKTKNDKIELWQKSVTVIIARYDSIF